MPHNADCSLRPHDSCPNCGVSWLGKPIPQEYIDKGYYGPATHYRREIGIEYTYSHPDHYDGVSEWLCPDCNARFGRWSSKVLQDGEFEPKWGVAR